MTVPVVAPAVPPNVTSSVAKSATDSLKTTVKLMELPLVGSLCPPAWSIVTVGPVVSVEKVTVLSRMVATLFVPAAGPVISLVPLPVTVPVVAPAVPPNVTSSVAGTAIGRIALPAGLVNVTVGPVVSVEKVTVLSVDVEALLALPTLSVAISAPMVAMTRPPVVMPVTATL